MGNDSSRIIKDTEYQKLHQDSDLTIGISHHKTGLGKLKIVQDGAEYGVPVTDIINEPLGNWRIDKK